MASILARLFEAKQTGDTEEFQRQVKLWLAKMVERAKVYSLHYSKYRMLLLSVRNQATGKTFPDEIKATADKLEMVEELINQYIKFFNIDIYYNFRQIRVGDLVVVRDSSIYKVTEIPSATEIKGMMANCAVWEPECTVAINKSKTKFIAGIHLPEFEDWCRTKRTFFFLNP